MPLVLSRRKGQSVLLEVPGWPTMRITVTEVHRSSCKLSFETPGVVVARAELHEPLLPPEKGAWTGGGDIPDEPRKTVVMTASGGRRYETDDPKAVKAVERTLRRLNLKEDRSIEQQKADGDYPNPYANNEGEE